MGVDSVEITVNIAKLLIIFIMMVNLVPMLVWLERRGSAFIQNRLGPNRVGPLGLLQLAADAVKFIFKEQFIPDNAVKFLFNAAPVMALIPAALAFAAIPLSIPLQVDKFELLGRSIGPYVFNMQSIQMDLGIVYVMGVSSLGAYGLLAAGFGSGNKFSLMGALRASAQMISYELGMGLAIVSVILLYGTFNFTEMINHQEGPLSFVFGDTTYSPSRWIPNWGIFFQPIGAFLFLAAAFAETNRLPFDMPEAEGELVAGFHTEYGGFKMLLFFMGEYGHMMVASALFSIFYLGGYNLPWTTVARVRELMVSNFGLGNIANTLTMLVFLATFLVKVGFFLCLFILVRWTLPRFRYDHLMSLGWKTMLPWALGNAIVTAVVLFMAHK